MKPKRKRNEPITQRIYQDIFAEGMNLKLARGL